MMKALIVGGLVLLTLLAVAPAAEAAPLPCSYYVSPDAGYVACRTPVGCVWVAYGGQFGCVP
jgi:hypothetical protein